MFRRSAKNRNPTNEASALRTKQLHSLRTQNPNATAVTQDQSQWDVNVDTQFGRLKYRIYIPPNFPEQGPTFQLLVQAQHPWVGQNLVIKGHPNLSQWSPHNDLGRIAVEVTSEFLKNPPAPAPVNANGNVGGSNNPSLSPSPSLSSSHESKERERRAIPSQSIPDTFPQLDGKSTIQLEDMLANEDSFSEFFDQLENVKSLNEVRNDMYKQLEDLARINLSKKDTVDNLREELSKLRSSFDENLLILKGLKERQAAVTTKFSKKRLTDDLTSKIREAESESDSLIKQLTEGELAVDEFTKQYMKTRKTYHLRMAKRERLMYAADVLI